MRTIEELTYEPVNRTLKSVAVELIEDRAVGVVLEPGDMTRYDLLLAPCWVERFRDVAVGTGDGGNFLLVGLVGSSLVPVGRGAHWSYVLEKLNPHGGNAHSGEVITEFLDRLWAEIARLSD